MLNSLIIGIALILAASIFYLAVARAISTLEPYINIWLLIWRQELILKIEDCGFEVPEWLAYVDDEKETSEQDGKLLHLIPTSKKDKNEDD